MELTTSCLSYVFADRYVRQLGWMGRMTGECALTTPWTGTLVSVAKVEALCVAAALRSLARSGFVSISEKSAGQLRNSPWRSGSRLATFDGRFDLQFQRVGARPHELVGLEALIFSAVSEDPADLTHIIDSDSLDRPLVALDALLVPVQEEAVAAGAVQLGQRMRRRRCLNWSIHSQYEVVESMRTALDSQVALVEQRGLLGDHQPEFLWLLRECTQALAAVRPSPTEPLHNPAW